MYARLYTLRSKSLFEVGIICVILKLRSYCVIFELLFAVEGSIVNEVWSEAVSPRQYILVESHVAEWFWWYS
jgi:hypothetical protein